MVKRKSITGVRKKKPVPTVNGISKPTTVRVADPGSPDDDILEQPEAGGLVHLNVNKRVRSGAPTRKPERLESRVEHVSSRTIKENWHTLDKCSQEAVKQLMEAMHLPVLANFPNEKTKAEAQDLIDSIQVSLFDRLPKTPFPKTTENKHFKYEDVTAAARILRDRVDDISTANTALRNELATTKDTLATLQQTSEAVAREVDSSNKSLGGYHYLLLEGPEIADRPSDIDMTNHRTT